MIHFKIQNLNKKNLTNHIQKLIKIDETVFPSDKWTKENFRVELPDKWKLSYLATINDTSVGYAICSKYNNKIHLHRLAVDPRYAGNKIGTKLCNNLLKISSEKQMQITVQCEYSSLEFYKKLGFVEMNVGEIKNYLNEKGKQNEQKNFYRINKGGLFFVLILHKPDL